VLGEALRESFNLIISGDGEFYRIVARSLVISFSAVILASLAGIPLGLFLGLRKFPGRAFLFKLVYASMGLPPVFVGLIVFLFLSRSGPVAPLVYILFTPWAMIIAQFILAVPIIAGLTANALEGRAPTIILTARGLGASPRQALQTLLGELRVAMVAAMVAAFGRVSAEVGAVMLVGGDIQGYTQVLTTAIVLETRRGNFPLAMALGLVLLLVAFLVNSLLYSWQYRR